MSKVFTFFGSQSRFGVNLFFMREGEPQPPVGGGEIDKDKVNKGIEGIEGIEGKPEALATAESIDAETKSYLPLAQLYPKDVLLIKENLNQFDKKDLLPQLKAQAYAKMIRTYLPLAQLYPADVLLIEENLERLRGLLPQLPLTDQKAYDDLIKEVEPQLLGLKAQAYAEMINYYLSLAQLYPADVLLIEENLEKLKGLLPPNSGHLLSLIEEFEIELGQLIGQQQEQSSTIRSLGAKFAPLQTQILNAIAQSAQSNQPEQPEKPE